MAKKQPKPSVEHNTTKLDEGELHGRLPFVGSVRGNGRNNGVELCGASRLHQEMGKQECESDSIPDALRQQYLKLKSVFEPDKPNGKIEIGGIVGR